MIKKKICLLGAFAVGKTSLVRQFIHSIFSEKYQTTVGVKVDKKEVCVNGQDVALMIWDIYGGDEIQKVDMNYVRGAAGYLLVIDGTRRDTLDRANEIVQDVKRVIGDAPFLALLNKADLREEWEVSEDDLADLAARGWITTKTSAKTGDGVEAAFRTLTEKILAA